MVSETATNKVQEICDVIRKSTLDPAKEEAKKIIEEAKATAGQIIHEANVEAERINEELKQELDKKRKVFDSTIELSVKQAVSQLRQAAVGLFSDTLSEETSEKLRRPDIIAKLINAIVTSLEKEGNKTNLVARIPKEVSAEEVVSHLQESVRKRVSRENIELSNVPAGVSVALVDQKISIEITDKALLELLGNYLPDVLREKLFG